MEESNLKLDFRKADFDESRQKVNKIQGSEIPKDKMPVQDEKSQEIRFWN